MSNALGKQAEEAVSLFLTRRGFKIVARNVTFPFGELDLVANDGATLVFIEVKYRKSTLYGAPYEAVGRSKQKKIILAAKAYLQRLKTEPPCRFDVISMWGDLEKPHIEHIQDAFLVEDY